MKSCLFVNQFIYVKHCWALWHGWSQINRWGRATDSLESLYWPNFQWANHQCYSNVRPMWGGTEGTDYGGLGQALSSDGQMAAGDWLGGGRSKPQPGRPWGPPCLRRQEPRRVSRASFTKAWKLLLLSLRLSCGGKTKRQILWLETNPLVPESKKCAIFFIICIKITYSIYRFTLYSM